MPFFADFTAFCGSLAVVGYVVRITAHFPQVSFHGLFATGRVLLRREVLLVRGDLVEIALTSLHSSRYSFEASASIQLVLGFEDAAVRWVVTR